MILDNFAQFTGFTAATGVAAGNADGTDTPTASGTSTSSGIIDLHMAGIPVLANLQGARDIGIGDDPAIKLMVQCATAAVGGTSMAVNLQGATDNGSGAPATFVTFFGSPVYTTAQLVLGAQLLPFDMPRPPQGVAIPRFLTLQYVEVGAVVVKVRGNLVLDRIDQPYLSTSNAVLGGYPAGITIAN